MFPVALLAIAARHYPAAFACGITAGLIIAVAVTDR